MGLRSLHLFAAVLVLSVFSASCSLKYDQEGANESTLPELTFTNVVYSTYEKGKLSLRLEADLLEQYKDNSSAFAKNVKFSSWESGKKNTEGQCLLLSINSKEEIYTLYQDILIHSYEQETELKAQNLKWNGKTEQLTSGKDEEVYLKRNDLELSGSGFSASGVSQSFQFTGRITGYAEPSQEAENPAENSAEKKQ